MKIWLIVLFLCMGSHARDTDAPYHNHKLCSAFIAVVAPDGKSFYTKSGKTVIQWKLSPLEKMNVIEITEDKFAINMFIVKNQKRMIIQSYGGLTLWDLKTNKLLKNVKEDIYSAVLNGPELITIENRNITKWDSGTLEKTSTVRLDSDILDSHYGANYSSPNLLIDVESNTLVIITQACVFLLDNRTLDIRKVMQRVKRDFYMSLDHKTLYVYLEPDKLTKIDIRTADMAKVERSWIVENKRQLVYYNKGIIVRPYSSFSSSSLVSKGGYRFFNNKTNEAIAKFNQFEDCEGLLIENDGYFEASSDNKKYLQIRTPSGKFLPIDDQTYSRYRKRIDLQL